MNQMGSAAGCRPGKAGNFAIPLDLLRRNV